MTNSVWNFPNRFSLSLKFPEENLQTRSFTRLTRRMKICGLKPMPKEILKLFRRHFLRRAEEILPLMPYFGFGQKRIRPEFVLNHPPNLLCRMGRNGCRTQLGF